MKAVISNRLLSSLKPSEKPYEVRDTQLPGFILRVQPSGYKSYIAEYRRGKRITIGSAAKLTAAQARDEAKAKLATATLGDDPMEERKAAAAYDLKTYLQERYQPYMEAHFKTGAKQVQKIRSAFPGLAGKKLTEITAWMVQKRNSQRLKKVKASTVNRDLEALKAAFARALEWKLIKEHPLRTVKRLKQDESARVRYLAEDEEMRLFEALDDREERIRKERDSANAWRRERGYKELSNRRVVAFADHLKPMVIASMYTGVRRGELFSLTWPDVDLERAMLTVAGGGAKSHQTKHIPLNADVLKALKGWREQSSGAGYVFPGRGGGRLNHVTTSWQGVLTAAKLRDFRWHDLRHDFASKLVMAGEDLNTVRELLGHSDIKMTLRYAHLSPEKKRAAVEKLVAVQ